MADDATGVQPTPAEEAPGSPPEPQAAPTPAPAAPPPPEPAPSTQEGRYVPLDRLNDAVRQKYDAIRDADALRAQLAEAQRQLNERTPAGSPDNPPSPQASPPITQAEIMRLADERADWKNFNDKCNDSVAKGRKKFEDFDKAIDSLRSVAPAVDAQGRPVLPRPFVEAALETGEGEAVLYALGKDTSEADRIMSLSPYRQAVELTRLADKIKAEAADAAPAPDEGADLIARAQQVSNAPPPIKGKVGAGGAAPGGKPPSVYDTDKDGKLVMSTEEWLRARQEEVERNRQANGQFGVRR